MVEEKYVVKALQSSDISVYVIGGNGDNRLEMIEENNKQTKQDIEQQQKKN